MRSWNEIGRCSSIFNLKFKKIGRRYRVGQDLVYLSIVDLLLRYCAILRAMLILPDFHLHYQNWVWVDVHRWLGVTIS